MNKKRKRYSSKKFKAVIAANTSLVEKRKNSTLSEGEKKIAYWLNAYSIEYIREHYMKGLYSPITGLPLFFDFYIPSLKIAIEYDGIHHFKPQYGTEEFKGQKARDNFKNYFCRKNKIRLLSIPFFKHKKIKDILYDEVKKYYYRESDKI